MQLITATYREGITASFTDDGWLNATALADHFGKRPVDWLRLDSTKDYIAALTRHLERSEESSLRLNTRNRGDLSRGEASLRSEECSLLKVKRGGRGKSDVTWFHPKLAIPFARWLDVDFAIWCDLQIDAILRGQHPAFDWKRARSDSASSNKVMNAVLRLFRLEQGKATASHHYSNEARLVNWALTGEFTALDRNSLSASDLALLAQLEETNTVLIGLGWSYQDRKAALERRAQDARQQLIH